MLTPSGRFTIAAFAVLFGFGFAARAQTQVDARTQSRNGPSLTGDNVWAGNNDFSGALSVLLAFPWASLALPSTYTAGATQTFQGSQDNAPWGMVGQPAVPNKIQGGQFFMTMMAILSLFDGNNANMFVMFPGVGKQIPVAPSGGICAEWRGGFYLVAAASNAPCGAPVTSTDPGCAVLGDIGKQWVDNTSSVTTHFKMCAAVSSVAKWVTVF